MNLNSNLSVDARGVRALKLTLESIASPDAPELAVLNIPSSLILAEAKFAPENSTTYSTLSPFLLTVALFLLISLSKCSWLEDVASPPSNL